MSTSDRIQVSAVNVRVWSETERKWVDRRTRQKQATAQRRAIVAKWIE